MGTLIDKLRNAELPAHEFTDVLMVWAESTGPAQSWHLSRQNVVDWWSLSPTDETELDALATRYLALATTVGGGDTERSLFADRVERAARLLQMTDGAGTPFWTDQQVRDYLGI